MNLLSSLERQVYEAQARGHQFAAAEVGIGTWEQILDIVEAQSRERWDVEQRARMSKGPAFFMGIPIRASHTVPEGTLWPIDGVGC